MTAAPADTITEAFGALLDPANRADPYPVYARIREASPAWVEAMPAMVVARYRDCEAVLRDSRMSSDRTSIRQASVHRVLPDDAPSSLRQPWFVGVDPPDHTRLRRLVSKAFTVRTVAGLEPRMAAMVDDLLDRAAERDQFDLVADLAYPLPIAVICQILGVPMADEPLFHDWSVRLVKLADGFGLNYTDGEDVPDWLLGEIELHRYIGELIDSRRKNPGDDLISRLIAVEAGGDRLTRDEMVSTVVLLLLGGHETTVNLISHGSLALLRNPHHLAALRADPDLAERTVEEAIRYDPSLQLTNRLLSEDGDVCGVPLTKGSIVLLLLGATGRDPDVFDQPDTFDPTRPDLGHISFAAGPHYCLGAPLARLEARLALTRLSQRVTQPTLATDPPPYREHLNLRGPAAIPVDHTGIAPRSLPWQ